MQGKTLREIYEYDLIPEECGSSCCDEWFNTIMGKTEEQLTAVDVGRMLRQRICSVIAIGKAIEMLMDDPFIGEMYEGQLMINLCHAKEKYLCKRYCDIEPLLTSAAIKAKEHEWQSECERLDFSHTIEEFARKIRESKSDIN